MSAQIRVLIVDDDALVRAGLTMLLAGAGDIEIVGVEGREDDDLRRVVARTHDFGGRETVYSRHAYVHQHDVGLAFGNGVLDLAAVSGLADDLDVASAREKNIEPGAD